MGLLELLVVLVVQQCVCVNVLVLTSLAYLIRMMGTTKKTMVAISNKYGYSSRLMVQCSE